MSNLDNIVNKAKSLMGVASKKTGEIFEVSKFKISKINKNAELQKNFESLGKLFFNEISNSDSFCSKLFDKSDETVNINTLENIKLIISNIKKIQSEISELNDGLIAMKSIKICENCGNKNNKKALYCNVCGNSLFNNNFSDSYCKNNRDFEDFTDNNSFNKCHAPNYQEFEIKKDYITNKITEDDICKSDFSKNPATQESQQKNSEN